MCVCLGFPLLYRAHVQALALPAEVQAATRPQTAILRHIIISRGEAPFADFRHRRLHTLLLYCRVPQHVELVALRLRWAFAGLFYVALALVMLANARLSFT